MGTPEGHQKSIFYIPKNKNKQRYDKVCNLNIKKLKKISNKSMFSTSKVKRRKKFV
jgi:hypothetical protein